MDCDNTLWGGVVGEDGALGVDAGEDAPGNAHVELQRYALRLREQGVLLAIVSKNDEPDVWEVFDRHPGMLLKREHLAAARINWRPKSENLRELAAELRLGSDSLVFIDDSPAECAEVRANAPEITVIHLDDDPAHFVGLLERACAFDRLALTSEDAQRAEMYSQERQREQLRGGATMDEYLAGLQLVVRIATVGEEHVARVAQLVNKTNQFNLTTGRRTESEVRTLVSDPSWRAYAVWVQDRFGDYGLTGAAFCRREPESWSVDTLLLSCRVLGRGVETALLSCLLQQAEADGASRLRGRFIPSAKNEMAAAYYPDHGFYEEEPGLFAREVEPGIPMPAHLTLETDGNLVSARTAASLAG
jgi:FkbH-like protein